MDKIDIAALDSGKLAGYAAAVLNQDPPPNDRQLLHHPKVIIAPQIAVPFLSRGFQRLL